ncbi:mucin-2-like [Bufo gargarizans]|uniref:mucin-2-like n=1 Tax=Bufo gargarizans TaxID=30331 RepID=UPI001CF4F9C1|nr:mucin-2-like [Bufo gargarizans]
MNPLLWLSLLALCLGAANSQNAKTCASCHPTAAVCTQKTGYVTCSCISGYVGNGTNCALIASCTTSTCCSQGYYWDNRIGYKVCTDINECADSTLNKCVPSTTCVNRAGIFLCGSSRNVACSSATCAFDQDCLNVTGVVQCADPCLNYQLLNGTSRLSTINSTGVFTTDRYNFGWFRYTGTGLRMQEGCVGAVKCGSAEAFTLNSTHPAIGQGIFMMSLQSNTVSGCRAAGTIPVKACPGGYYVYKFSGSLQSEVYCTDPSPFVVPTLPPTTTTTTTPTTTTPTTTTPTTSTPTTTTTTTTTPTTTTPTTTTPTTTSPTTTSPTTTTPTTTSPTTTTPTTTSPTTTTPTTTSLTTTTPTTTSPTTTTPTTTTPTTTPTTTTPTTTIPTTTTTITPTTTIPTTTTTTLTTTTPITTTPPPPTTTSIPTTPLKTTIQPQPNITVTTLRSSSIVSVTSKTELRNRTEMSSLELNETTTVYIEVKTISPTTVTTNINSSAIPFYSRTTIGFGPPMTFTERPAPQNSGNESVAPNQQPFQANLYTSTPAQTKTITETFTVDNGNFTSTTTTTTITTEEVIVIEQNFLP